MASKVPILKTKGECLIVMGAYTLAITVSAIMFSNPPEFAPGLRWIHFFLGFWLVLQALVTVIVMAFRIIMEGYDAR